MANNEVENKSGIGNYIKKLLAGSISGGAIGGLLGGINDYSVIKAFGIADNVNGYPVGPYTKREILKGIINHNFNPRGYAKNLTRFGAGGALAGLLTAIYQGSKSDK